MHGKPDILSIAPHVIGQSNGHRRGALLPPLLQALVRDHEVVETDYQPDPSSMACHTPGQAAGATSQSSYPSPKRAIPSFHKRSLDGGTQPVDFQLLEKAPRTSKGIYSVNPVSNSIKTIAYERRLLLSNFYKRIIFNILTNLGRRGSLNIYLPPGVCGGTCPHSRPP